MIKLGRLYKWKSENYKDKISVLGKSSKLLDQKFISLVKNSEKCNDMLEIISEANTLKRKSDEQVDDMRELEETSKLLKEQKRKL